MQVVLCSGGIDSLVCAELAREAGELAGCVFVDYQHPAQQAEGWKVFAYCGSRGIPLRVPHAFGLDLAGMAPAAWEKSSSGRPVTQCCGRDGRDFEANGHRSGCPGNARVVPARNAILLSLAANAAKSMGGTTLTIGANAADDRDYSDCRRDFMDAMGAALGVQINTPLIDMTKPEIISEAVRLGLRKDEAWSCYGAGPVECGRCASCVEASSAWLTRL